MILLAESRQRWPRSSTSLTLARSKGSFLVVANQDLSSVSKTDLLPQPQLAPDLPHHDPITGEFLSKAFGEREPDEPDRLGRPLQCLGSGKAGEDHPADRATSARSAVAWKNRRRGESVSALSGAPTATLAHCELRVFQPAETPNASGGSIPHLAPSPATSDEVRCISAADEATQWH
jgi:hypothetical protein